MIISYRPTFASAPEVSPIEWPELVRVLTDLAVVPRETKQDVPLIAFGHFSPDFKETSLQPPGLYAIAFDFDGIPDDAFARALTVATNMTQHVFAHTTWRHASPADGWQPGATYGRIVLPLTKPVEQAHFPGLWRIMADAFAGVGAQVDEQCKNVGRCYYVPATNPKAIQPTWVQSW